MNINKKVELKKIVDNIERSKNELLIEVEKFKKFVDENQQYLKNIDGNEFFEEQQVRLDIVSEDLVKTF